MSNLISNSNLVSLACQGAAHSHSPYSNFRVGAALLCADGSVYTGCNIENASYSATTCAERVAFQKAVSEGKKEFVAIAIVGGKDNLCKEACTPCGVCRQVMSEFCKEDFKIILSYKEDDTIKFKEYTLSELLPNSFKL